MRTVVGIMLSAVLELKPAELDDAHFVARLHTMLHPDEPSSGEVLAHYWGTVDPAWNHRRFVAHNDSRRVGFASLSHRSQWEQGERYAFVDVVLPPGERSTDRVDALLEMMESMGRADGATAAHASTREDEPVEIQALQGRGYRYDRLSKAWELDLSANRDRLLAMTERSRQAMAEQSIRLVKLIEVPDPEINRKLHEVATEAEADIPTTVPIHADPFDLFMHQLKGPARRQDAYWVALDGDRIAGLSFLTYPPGGNVWTGFTATARSHRGRGIARAVKMETLAQAIGWGVDKVRTDNDSENAPMLHINEVLGYHRIPGFIEWLREL